VAFTTAVEFCDARGLASADGWVVEFEPAIVGLTRTSEDRIRPHPGHGAWLSFLPADCLAHQFELPVELIQAWTYRGERLLSEVHDRPVGYNRALASHLTLLLLDIARLAFPQLEGPAMRHEPVVTEMFCVIEQRFDQPLSLDDVARAVAVSPGHLARVARSVTGRSVNAWIADRRMVEARRLLLDERTKVEQVAFRSGFSDVGYFRRQFRRYHGVSPAQWRDVAGAESATASWQPGA